MTTTFYVSNGPTWFRRVVRATDARGLALAMSEAFVGDVRANGEHFVHLRDGSPQWMTDVVHTAHGDMLPDDFRYETIRAIVDALCERDVDAWGDDRHEIVDGCVDVYNSALLAWLASDVNRSGYVDEARDDGLSVGCDTIGQISAGQYREIDEIYGLIVGALEAHADALDDGAP